MAETTFIGDFKRNFFTGIAALFPILITFFLFSWVYGHLDRTINRGFTAALAPHPALFAKVFPGAPPEVVEDEGVEKRREYVDQHLPWSIRFIGVTVGIVAALVAVYLTGIFLRGYFGARIVRRMDRLFERFPLVKSVYPHARQVADFLFGGADRPQFRRVVAVQYPRRGIYTVGLVTGGGLKGVEDETGLDFVTVFIPTSPTPVTGFVILVPRDNVIELDMNVEDTLKFAMTAGMVAGTKQRPWTFATAEDEEEGPGPSVGARLRQALLNRNNGKSQETGTS